MEINNSTAEKSLKSKLDLDAEKEGIKSFDKQIEALDKLSFSEAKRLYEIANNSDFDSIREAYIKWIVSDTLYVVDDFIKKNQLELLENSKYDIEDIRSTLIEYWIKCIRNGMLLKRNGFTTILYDMNTMHYLYNHLGEEKYFVKKMLGVTQAEFEYLVPIFLDNKNNKKELNCDSLLDIIKEEDPKNYPNCYKIFYKDGKQTEKGMKVIRLLNNIYNSITQDGLNELTLSYAKIRKITKLLIANQLHEELSENYSAEDQYESILDNITFNGFINDVDELIIPKQRIVIHKRYGIDEEEPKTYEAIGKELNITRERVRQIEIKALKKLNRQSNYFQEKYSDNYSEDKKDDKQDFLELYIRLFCDKIEPKSIEEAMKTYNVLHSKKQGQKTKKKI